MPRPSRNAIDHAAPPCPVCGGTRVRSLFEKAGHAYVACVACDLQRIDPPPTDEQLAAIYGRHYYDAWGLDADAAPVAALKHATFRLALAAAEPLSAGAAVLDCGAATGFLMDVAAARGLRPYGVELSAYGAEAIATRFGRERVFEGELQTAHFVDARPGEFAAVFMCDYLEHVREPAAVLRRAAAWLRPGGTIVLSTPRIGSLSQRVMGAGWTHYKTEHLQYFTPGNLERLLVANGFTDVRVAPAWKTMSLDYVVHQLETYVHPLLTPLARLLGRLPAPLRERRFPALLGEMLVTARRPGTPSPDAPPAG